MTAAEPWVTEAKLRPQPRQNGQAQGCNHQAHSPLSCAEDEPSRFTVNTAAALSLLRICCCWGPWSHGGFAACSGWLCALSPRSESAEPFWADVGVTPRRIHGLRHGYQRIACREPWNSTEGAGRVLGHPTRLFRNSPYHTSTHPWTVHAIEASLEPDRRSRG
ncbi:hypothetical protein T440DRAFT_327964 [Plenodomus tracheiphilus IPT5]|uniref:Uncharacterized protein n=1 Tax=Plenodomus tracheiphilus IPT5 TaxID=1408161 RepID=A0A6A7AMT7_9PLEO|nr:hypothetical protein T440DRAFT_327964 [Plenodomus tracheiphilus IPT5]